MRILLCSDGSPLAVRALVTGAEIALAMEGPVEILLVRRKEENLELTSPVADSAADELRGRGRSVTFSQRVGRLPDEVIRLARSTPYDLVVIGSRGRRGVRRLLLGSQASHIIDHVPASVLVVKGGQRPLRRFLVCSAAGPASHPTIRFAARMAQALGASVTLLHVISQVPATGGSGSPDLDLPVEELIRKESQEGLHLSQMTDLLTVEGVETRAIVRYGLVLDEIKTEVREGHHDLLVIGAHTTPGIRNRLLADLSKQTLLAADLTVLVVRQSVSGSRKRADSSP